MKGFVATSVHSVLRGASQPFWLILKIWCIACQGVNVTFAANMSPASEERKTQDNYFVKIGDNMQSLIALLSFDLLS